MRNAQSGRRRCFRFRHRVASGEIRHVDVYSGPVMFGKQPRLLSIIHDVSDREALASQLREAQRLESVGRLAGSVAHEFNNLLTVMLGAWSMLDRTIGKEDAARRFVDDLGFSHRTGRGAVARLARFQPPASAATAASWSLNDVVRDLVALLQRSLGTTVALELEPR